MAEIFRLENVTKVYKNDKIEFTALKNINLSITEGEIFGIIGMSGAGKSTLVRTLNRLEDVSEGSVSFYGKNLSELKPSEIRKVRRQIAMIFQSFNLLSQRSVLSNVMQPLKIAGVSRPDRKKKALEMLKVVGLEEKKHQFPSRLSGGQKQRVAIASAVAAGAKLLLFDEPTSGLDLSHMEMVGQLLTDLARSGSTVLVSTHDPELIGQCCDYILCIDKGKVGYYKIKEYSQ